MIPANLHHRGDNEDARSHVHTPDLVGNKEYNDWEKVSDEFHSTGKIVGIVLLNGQAWYQKVAPLAFQYGNSILLMRK
jgi:hypothetical protein